jgi:hypothetical protein
MMLDPESVEAIAVRVVELLEERGPGTAAGQEMITAEEVARRFGVKAAWVRRNADRLGAVRLGDGPRARLRFDPERVAAALSSRSNGVASDPPAVGSPTGIPPRRRRRSRSASGGNPPASSLRSAPLPKAAPATRQRPGARHQESRS